MNKISPFDYQYQKRLQARQLPKTAGNDKTLAMQHRSAGCGHPERGDRFILSRETMRKCDTIATYSLKRPRNSYQEALMEAVFPSFSEKTLRNGPVKKFKPLIQAQKWNFPQYANSVLDAPGLLNDFYSNNLHWGKKRLGVNLANTCYVWDLSTRKTCEVFSSHAEDNLLSLKWRPDGNSIGIGSSNSRVVVLDAKAGDKIFERTFVNEYPGIYCMNWRSENELTIGDKGNIIFNDLRCRSSTLTIQTSINKICGLEWSPNTSLLARGGDDDLVEIFDIRKSTASLFSYSHLGGIKALKWVPNSSNLFSGGGSADKTMKLFDTVTGNHLCEKRADAQICGVEFFDSHTFAIGLGGGAGQIGFWHLNRSYDALNTMHSVYPGGTRVLDLSKDPNSLHFASLSSNETLQIWELNQRPKKVLDRGKLEPTFQIR